MSPGFTGIEVSPGEVEVEQEIHISGDISFAIMQLWKATHDGSLLAPESFGEVILGIADFWIDRMQFNAMKGTFEIIGGWSLLIKSIINSLWV